MQLIKKSHPNYRNLYENCASLKLFRTTSGLDLDHSKQEVHLDHSKAYWIRTLWQILRQISLIWVRKINLFPCYLLERGIVTSMACPSWNLFLEGEESCDCEVKTLSCVSSSYGAAHRSFGYICSSAPVDSIEWNQN